MANFFKDNEDLLFYVEKGIDWEPLVHLTEYEYRAEDGFESSGEAVEFYRDILEAVGRLAAEEIAPKAAEIDRLGLEIKDGEVIFPQPLKDIFETVEDMELHGMCLPRELGGANCPLLVYFINAELISRGEAAVMAHYSFHGGIAMALLMYSLLENTTEFQTDPPRITKTRFQEAIEEIAAGKAWGSMDITEPGAGSDMGAIVCKGEQDAAGNWLVSGQKTFITSGHGKYHLVIARTEPKKGDDAFGGLQGLSLFLVPAYEEDADGGKKWLVTLDRLEEKIGHHGSATVSVNYDRTPAQLIGNRGDGFKLMLNLMNNARIGVGFESLGLCEAVRHLARSYAAERPSMGKTIDRHEIIADYLDEMDTDILGIRALSMYGAFHEEMAQKLRMKVLALAGSEQEKKQAEKEQAHHQKLSRAVTPLIKFLAAEKAVEMARRGIQILGGYGYTRDYGAEKLLRDALVFPIYEGTSQIQALMAMKDNLMGVLKAPQTFAQDFVSAQTLRYASRDKLARRVEAIRLACSRTLANLMSRIAVGKAKAVTHQPVTNWVTSFFKEWDPKTDFAPAMLHAERLTWMLADKAVCEILLEQSRKFPERRSVLERYLERAEPRVAYYERCITKGGDRLLQELRANAEDE
jgi:3-(methylthio)propanoyl-CoA dehydrogenase